MRRIVDGVKVSERWKTTEQVERAFVEDAAHSFLYADDEGFHFMNPESYDQLVMDKESVGDAAAYLEEGMSVILSVHEGRALALELPRHATLEVVETEPVVKGQTASSSYKPAILSNGVRTLVPATSPPAPASSSSRKTAPTSSAQGLILFRNAETTKGAQPGPGSALCFTRTIANAQPNGAAGDLR